MRLSRFRRNRVLYTQEAVVCFTSASAANCESARILSGSEHMVILGHIVPNGQVGVVYVCEINKPSVSISLGSLKLFNNLQQTPT